MPRQSTQMRQASSTRRAFLSSLTTLAAVTPVFAEQEAPIPVTAIQQVTLEVSDLSRSVSWYRKLLGLSVLRQTATDALLQLGDSSQSLRLSQSKPDAKPRIALLRLAVESYDVESVQGALARAGVVASDSAGPLKSVVSSDRRLVRFADFDGISVQLGGAQPPQPTTDVSPPVKSRDGLLAVRDINHLTILVNDQARAVAFYRRVFGFPIDTYQGSLPILRVGSGNQFLALLGTGGKSSFLHHACLTVERFDPERILAQLKEYGIRARQGRRRTGPLESYVSMRMPDRGGAPGGTPELYFTDPDGILLQLQDVRYCGGGGYLGEQRGNLRGGGKQ